ncbi:MAG: glycogen-binding domain-containing protein [Gemmatimonadaceae bacterium]
MRWRRTCSLAITLVVLGAGAAGWSPLRAQATESGAADSSFALSVGVRSWLAVTGPVDGPVAGLRLRTQFSWLLVRLDANASAGNRSGGGSAGPSLLDGQFQLSTTPMRVGKAGADARVGLERDAFDPTTAWMQQSGSLRTWYGTAARGVWAQAGVGAPVNWHATPTSNEVQLGGWMTRGATQLSASLQHIATGRLAAVGADSATINPALCRLDYDPNRPLQQYLTVCPQRLQTLDAGAAVVWDIRNLRVHLFVAHRMLGSTSFGVPIESWAGGNAELTWSDNVRFTLDIDRRPTDIVRGLPAYNRFAVGVRLMPWLRHEPKDTPAARGGAVVERHRMLLRLGAAASADVRGDFTDWKPVALTSDRDGAWALPSGIAPGVYTLSVRIDGGAWFPPPGLPTASDGFGGTVGVLVVP